MINHTHHVVEDLGTTARNVNKIIFNDNDRETDYLAGICYDIKQNKKIYRHLYTYIIGFHLRE